MQTTSEIIVGDCREVMAGMAAESVQCVVTSPPYWGLRDYGTAEWEGGDAVCDHVAPPKGGPHTSSTLGPLRDGLGPDNAAWADSKRKHQFRGTCGKCGARRVDRQLGLESTPDEYLAGMVDVFRAVKRVLRDDGTCWVNMGDGYASSNNGGAAQSDSTTMTGGRKMFDLPARGLGGLKPKDLIGMPWRLAFALQADGWYLRSDIIWAKPNPMPESVTDRPTKSHEYMFLLTKRARYFYDADAVRETTGREAPPENYGGSWMADKNADGVLLGNFGDNKQRQLTHHAGRNLRDVWTIPTEAYAEAHFATFPRRLVEPCIKAGTSDKGCCPECGAPWRRVVENASGGSIGRSWGDHSQDAKAGNFKTASSDGYSRGTTVGWELGCECTRAHFEPNYVPIPCVVLDPFAGSGTTGVVAKQLGRSFVGCELNPEYADMARRRIENPVPLPELVDVTGQMDLFGVGKEKT